MKKLSFTYLGRGGVSVKAFHREVLYLLSVNISDARKDSLNC